MQQLVSETLDDLISAREAAERCGVSVDTIHKWNQKGYIEPSGLDNQNHRLYRFIDVLRAERKTRRQMLGASRIA